MIYSFIFSRDVYLQLIFILLTVTPAFVFYLVLRSRLRLTTSKQGGLSKLLTNRSIFLLIWLAFAGISLPFYLFLPEAPTSIIYPAFILLITFSIICIVNSIFKPVLALIFKVITWFFCTLFLTGLFFPLVNYLNNTELNLGLLKTSYLKLIESIGLVGTLTWAALSISTKVENKLNKNKHINKSTKLLLSKAFRMLLLTLSFFLGMSFVGIDLSVITFFAGALGVAIGFGMQNILSNIFCGVILLLDRSVRPGDVISLDEKGSYGVVHKLNARYVSIRTPEGIEHIIPNESFINKKMENLTHSDPFIRIHTSFEVALDTDIDLLENLLLTVASSVKRIVENPAPDMRVSSIQNNAVTVKLRFWISDPENGVSGVKSEVYRKALLAFKENKIKIPYPPLELYLHQQSKLSQTLQDLPIR